MKGLLRRPYQGVTGFTGMPGSGKSYGLVEIAARCRRQGVPYFVNEGFDVEGAYVFSSFEDFLRIPNGCVVLWDELPIYVNARKWQEFPDGLLYRLTQIRKDSLRLYFSAIDEAMVDVTVRRLTFWWWKCQSITQRVLMRSKYPHESFRKKDSKPYHRELVRVRKSVASLYDTKGKIAAPAEALRRIEETSGVKWAKVETGTKALAAGGGETGTPLGGHGSRHGMGTGRV